MCSLRLKKEPKLKIMYTIKRLFLFNFIIVSSFVQAQQIATLEYGGGGDWYANPTAVPNLITFLQREYRH